MINLFNAHIENLSIHRVGNKSRNEAIFLSENPYGLNDEIMPLLKEFFFKPFREKEENYFQFAHEVDLEYNDMFNFATEVSSNTLAKSLTYPVGAGALYSANALLKPVMNRQKITVANINLFLKITLMNLLYSQNKLINSLSLVPIEMLLLTCK